MSQLLINEYLRDLAEIRKVGGSKNEGAVSEAFRDLIDIGIVSTSCTSEPKSPGKNFFTLSTGQPPQVRCNLRNRIGWSRLRYHA